VSEYTSVLVEGVAAASAEIDAAIAAHAEGWTLERMPTVDRNILRLATFELLHTDDVPDRVAIDEAVELAKLVSTDRSPAFINGVLGRMLAERAPS
jgi:N utilization substance protein B